MKKPANDNWNLNEFLEDGLGCCRGVFHALAGLAIFWIVAGIAAYVILKEYVDVSAISKK